MTTWDIEIGILVLICWPRALSRYQQLIPFTVVGMFVPGVALQGKEKESFAGVGPKRQVSYPQNVKLHEREIQYDAADPGSGG
jgi:hypothetical protein